MANASASASALAKLSKAQLLELAAELQAKQLEDSSSIAALQQAVANAQQPAPANNPECPSDFMVTGYLRSVTPVTNKSGVAVNDSFTDKGFFKVSVDVTAGVNFGSKDAANWQNILAKTAWFTTDGTVAQQLADLKEANKWTVVRVWYRLKSNTKNVITVPQKDYATGEQRVDKNGQPMTERKLQYAADMRIAQVDVVAQEQRSETEGSADNSYAF